MSDIAVPSDPTAFAREHARWHEQVEEHRTAPYGPLSVTSLDWLDATGRRFPGIPGTWTTDADGVVTVDLADGESLVQDGETITGTLRLGPLRGIESSRVEAGDLRIEVAARGGSIALRVRDPRSPDRVAYQGTDVFPPDPAWIIKARFVSKEQADVQVDSIIPDKPQHYGSPGIAEFEIDGHALRLVLFPAEGGEDLRAIFADTSERTFTAARTAPVTRTGPDSVVIDFNRSTNPPCAYSLGGTCPLPPSGNRLPLPIEAGEVVPGTLPER